MLDEAGFPKYQFETNDTDNARADLSPVVTKIHRPHHLLSFSYHLYFEQGLVVHTSLRSALLFSYRVTY